jgi:hypothetical protein
MFLQFRPFFRRSSLHIRGNIVITLARAEVNLTSQNKSFQLFITYATDSKYYIIYISLSHNHENKRQLLTDSAVPRPAQLPPVCSRTRIIYFPLKTFTVWPPPVSTDWIHALRATEIVEISRLRDLYYFEIRNLETFQNNCKRRLNSIHLHISRRQTKYEKCLQCSEPALKKKRRSLETFLHGLFHTISSVS